MKKIIVSILSISLFGAMSVSAQKFDLGVKFGVNGTKIKIDKDFPNSEFEMGAGYQFGAFARLSPFDKLYLQPELNYVVKKSEFNIENVPNASSTEVKLKNIEIPLLVGYELLDLKVAKLHVATGPLFAFNTSSADEVNLGSTTLSSAFAEFKKAQVNWQIGAAVDVLNFTLDVRYEKGLSDIREGDLGQKTNLFLVSLGFRFL